MSRVGLAIFPAFLMVALDVAVPAPITVLIVGISLVATSHRDGPHH